MLSPDDRQTLLDALRPPFGFHLGCAVGTTKSRVNRARGRLADLLKIESADDFGPDRTTRAVLIDSN